MIMPEEEKQKILDRGRFLEEKGYQVTTDSYGVDYFNGEIKIMAYYERYDNHSGLDIKFPGNYHFEIGWIAKVRDNVKTVECSLTERILALMDYLEENYEKITDYDYCDESYLLADAYMEQKRRENPELFPIQGLSYAESKEVRKRLQKGKE